MPLYRYIKLNGPISVDQWSGTLTPHDIAMIILIMGPSGAGKSHFIESFGRNTFVDTAADNVSLEGCTQSVSAFKLNNAEYADCVDEDDEEPWDIYLVDTPGLSGCNISVLEIIENLRVWMDSHGVNAIFRVVYFCSITGSGLSRRDRRAVETFKSMTGMDWAGSILVVTTGWDLLHGKEEQLCAERHFEQLRDDVWQDFMEEGGCITRFLNTQYSALEVLDRILSAKAGSYYHLEQMMDRDMHVRDTPFAPYVYRDLLDRIEYLRDQLRLVEAVRDQRTMQVDTMGDTQALDKDSRDIESRLVTFQRHLDNFGVFHYDIDSVMLEKERCRYR